MGAFCSYIILIGLFFRWHCQAAVITVPPVSVTVPPFTTATFTCEGTGNVLNWLIQSDVLTDSIKQQRQITVTTTNTSNTNFSSVLTVNAIPINDGLGIGCEVISFNPFNRVTLSGELTIRGVSRVEDIQYTFPTNTSLLITWSPPAYYSNDVPVGSPLSYQVLVRLVTEYDEEDTIILNKITSTTSIGVNDVTECDTFNISVTAKLAQYTSNNNTERNNGSLGYVGLGYVVNITTNKDNFQTPNVSIELSCPPSKCNTSLTITSDTKVIDHHKINGTDKVFNYDTRTLVPSSEYNYTVRVFNVRDKLEYETYTIITIYEVIGLYINNTYTNGSVSVQCVYELLSTADGCHVIFTDTSNGRNEYFNITGSDNTIISVSTSGVYNVTGYDIVNGSLYGPAVQYPTPVEIIKIMPHTSTSSSNTHESTTAPALSTVTNDVSPTITDTPGTGATSSTRENDNNYVLVVAGTASGTVLLILIILMIYAVIIVNKKTRMKGLNRRSEFATCQQPQAETNQYQEVHLIIKEVPLTRSSVQLTNSRPIDVENPYHVTRDEFLPNCQAIPLLTVEIQLMSQGQRPSITSTATQDTILEDSISSTTSNNVHDNAYTIDLTPNDTIIFTVNDTVATAPDNEATTLAATYTASAMATATAVAPTYAVIAKKTDATTIPAVDQHVIYDKVTGDINKREGGVTVYPSNDISAIPPPSSYADTVAQESATVSSSQFVVPVQVTDAAVVHGQYGKYPQTNLEDDYDINTPVQVETYTTDEDQVVLQLTAASANSNEDDAREALMIEESLVTIGRDQVSVVHFQWLVSIKNSLEANDKYTPDEIFGFKKSEEKQEVGAFVSGITFETKVHVHFERKNKIKNSDHTTFLMIQFMRLS